MMRFIKLTKIVYSLLILFLILLFYSCSLPETSKEKDSSSGNENTENPIIPSNTNAIFPENFDSTQEGDRKLPNGWKTNIVDLNTYIGVSKDIAYSNSNCLKLKDSSITEVADVIININNTPSGLIKFYFYIPTGVNEPSYFQLKGPQSYILINICFNYDGEIQIKDSNFNIKNRIKKKFPFDTWNKFEVRWDKNSGYFKIFLNNSGYGYLQMMNNSQNITNFKIMAGHKSQPLGNYSLIYIDDVDLNTNQQNIVDVSTLIDINNIPKFVTHDFCDVQEIDKISRFRSGSGHDYSDLFETNRSMKHYYEPINWASRDNDDFKIYSPVNGIITKISNEGTGYSGGLRNRQVKITSDQYPGIVFVLFHVNLLSEEIVEGKHVTAGEHIGYAQLIYLMPDGSEFKGHNFDIAVWANCIDGLRYVSYFDLLTDTLLNNNYINRGASSRKAFIITKEERDNDPLTLIPGSDRFVNPGNIENWIEIN